MQLTGHQQQALEYGCHLAVTANAGAGKTAVLVARYVDILANTTTRINEIVAITFAEKAAAELRTKIAARVEEKLRSVTTVYERQTYERIRDQLSSAMISTFHSFCAQLLREYPVEAGVDAAFSVLEGVDQESLLQQSIQSGYESILESSDDRELKVEFLRVVRMVGRTELHRIVVELLRKRELVERLTGSEGLLASCRPDEEILSTWKTARLEEVRHLLDEGTWLADLVDIQTVASGKKAPELASLLASWNPLLSTTEKAFLYSEIGGKVFTKTSSLRKDFIGSKTDVAIHSALEDRLARHHALTIPRIEDVLDESAEGDRTLLRVLRTLLKVIERCTRIYDERKADHGQLDFDDLQLRARILLTDEQLASRISLKYKYLMVDEFQDTNTLQYDILRSLVRNYSAGNLFIVGDAKQSIYGFRNAEVEVFERARRDIMSASGEIESISTKDSAEHVQSRFSSSIVLAESFRLLPDLVAFINRVFRPLMRKEESRYDVAYDELVRGRVSDGSGSVELLLVSDAGDDMKVQAKPGFRSDVSDPVRRECRMIAARLFEMRQSGYLIYDKKKGEDVRPFRYEDAAVLLRKRSNVRELEVAFADYGVPYILSSGVGFYQTQEVYDFFNYLKFILNPGDDVALVGILRSPMFSISDAVLFEISLGKPGSSFWQKTIEAVELKPELSGVLRRSVEVLTWSIAQANRESIPTLVHRLSLETGWMGSLNAGPRGRQGRANLKKLLTIARAFEGQGYVMLYDFVQRLSSLVEERDDEGQAPLEGEGDCVRVMTIHAAKGLEFPVVVVPFLHQKFRHDNAPYVDPSLGIAFKVGDEQNFDREVAPRLYNQLQRLSRQKTLAEEKRIFYVACTRAQNSLILSGRTDVDPSRPSYMNWLAEGIGVSLDSLRPGKFIVGTECMRSLSPDTESSGVLERQYELAISVRSDSPEQRPVRVVSLPNVALENTLPTVAVEPLTPQRRGEIFSATQIKTYRECPTKYYLQFILGLPKDHTAREQEDASDGSDTSYGDIEGTLTHAILQNLRSADVGAEWLRELVSNTITASFGQNMDRLQGLSEAVYSNAVKFVNSSIGKEILGALEAKN